MNDIISPKYQMKLVQEVHNKIWQEFTSYKEVLFYIKKWHKEEFYDAYNQWQNFIIVFDNRQNIDLKATLHNMQGDDLIRIAIDLGVETPDFIPSLPTFKNIIKEEYENVHDTFIKALKNIEQEPDLAIGLANSTFESLIKEILKDERISSKLKGGETLYKLVQIILKEFNISNENFPVEAKTISKSLLAISQAIEKLRSEKTNFHGKTKDDLIIEDPIYVYLIINSITSISLFLSSYYKKKFPKLKKEIINPFVDEDDLPF
ncbi:abortive infection family protein [Elizabethkingia anophelis]|uniref:abortive infection family protein n=1 Tax=Elizabethkingia anophelis TaxID=1117645 RepID=UPI003462B7A1